MRRFEIIRLIDGGARLVELYTYNGVLKEFHGPTCVSDALRHMVRCCSGERTFTITSERQYTR